MTQKTKIVAIGAVAGLFVPLGLGIGLRGARAADQADQADQSAQSAGQEPSQGSSAEASSKPMPPPQRHLIGTVSSIDKTRNNVTVTDDNGLRTSLQAPPSLRGIKDLKEGDKVSVSYYGPTLVAITQSGKPLPPSNGSDLTVQIPSGGGKSTATVAHQMDQTVSVVSYDENKHELSFLATGGKTQTVQVSDPAARDQVSAIYPGEMVRVVYTQPIARSIVPTKS
jgi:hypothetical protein